MLSFHDGYLYEKEHSSHQIMRNILVNKQKFGLNSDTGSKRIIIGMFVHLNL